MKTRNGFVSNSSSSSFVIAVKKSDACEHCGRRDPDILALIEKYPWYGDDTCINDIGKEGALEELRVQYTMTEEALEPIREKLDQYGDEYTIASMDLGYHNNELWEIFNSAVKNKTIEIVFDEEGRYEGEDNGFNGYLGCDYGFSKFHG